MIRDRRMVKRRLTPSAAASPIATSCSSSTASPIHSLDDGCLMHIFSFLSPIPGWVDSLTDSKLLGFSRSDAGLRQQLDVWIKNQNILDRYSIALVCHRWRYLACHPRLWLRVVRSIKSINEPDVFPNLEAAISAARPGDTILIAPGGDHIACNIQIKKPLCLIGGGELPDDTILTCSRGSESALEFLATCKITNLTIRTELGCCLLHRGGRLTIEGCILQCEENPLDYLSFPIISTANSCDAFPQALKGSGDCVTVARTRIEGGAKAVWTSGNLVLQRVRAIYSRTSIFFWFEVGLQ